jgi:integrase
MKLRAKVGKSQIWKSLGTKNKTIAKLRAEMTLMTIKQKIINKVKNELVEDLDWLDDDIDISDDEVNAAIRERSGVSVGGKPRKRLSSEEKRAKLPASKDFTEKEAETLAYEWLVGKVEKELETLKSVGKPVEERKKYQKLLDEVKWQYANWDYAIVEDEMTGFLFDFIEPKPSEATKNVMLNAFMRAKIQFLDYILSYLYGIRQNLSKELISGADEYVGSRKVINSIPDIGQCEESTFNLVELTEVYNNDISRERVSKEQKAKILLRIENIVEFMGDMSISNITDKDIENFIREIQCLPAHYGKMKVAKKFTLKQAIEWGKKDNSIQKISPSTLERYIQTFKSILQYAAMKEYIPKNPFDKISLPKFDNSDDEDNKRCSFSTFQLKTIFDSPVFSGAINDGSGWNTKGDKIFRNYKFFIPLISLYSGARLNEICQLYVEDIKNIDGTDFFSINDDGDKSVKKSTSRRNVPIHSELKKMGFMEYVEEMRNKNSKYLFPELTTEKSGRRSNVFSKLFGRLLKTVDKQLIDEKDKFIKSKHCFHSFRHTCRDCFRNNECENIEAIEAIMGWKGQYKGLSYYYGQGFTMPKLSEIMENKLIYHDLDLSHLYK